MQQEFLQTLELTESDTVGIDTTTTASEQTAGYTGSLVELQGAKMNPYSK